MIYKLFINYFRLKLLHIIVNFVLGRKLGKMKNSKNLKTMSIVPYIVELLATFYLSGKRKVK